MVWASTHWALQRAATAWPAASRLPLVMALPMALPMARRTLTTSPRAAAAAALPPTVPPAPPLVPRPATTLSHTNCRVPAEMTFKPRKVGRGDCNKGKSAGRGTKGWKARQHRAPLPGYEGGQRTLLKALPKLIHRRTHIDTTLPRYTPLALDELAYLLAKHRFVAPRQAAAAAAAEEPAVPSYTRASPLRMEQLVASRALGPITDGVFLSKRGMEFFNTPNVHIQVSDADLEAIAAIERLGGSVTLVYYDPLALRAICEPEKWAVLPPIAHPTRLNEIAKYTDPLQRGYLAPLVAGVHPADIVKTVQSLPLRQLQLD